jgi:hypothetical protein
MNTSGDNVPSEAKSFSVEGDNHSSLDLIEDYVTEEPKPNCWKRKRGEDDGFGNILALFSSANNTKSERLSKYASSGEKALYWVEHFIHDKLLLLKHLFHSKLVSAPQYRAFSPEDAYLLGLSLLVLFALENNARMLPNPSSIIVLTSLSISTIRLSNESGWEHLQDVKWRWQCSHESQKL